MRRLVQAGTVFILCLMVHRACWGDDTPASQPSAPAKTGKFDVTFTERSPLSRRPELARRLNLQEAGMGDDYDLAHQPFKVFVPTNYDPKVACGVIVYLGYKDTAETPAAWEPVLEKSHLIFISPVSHSGPTNPPAVQRWQSAGLALDAIYNLKKQYNIDDRRIYQMGWNVGAMELTLATSDVFTGYINAFDQSWGVAIAAGNGGNYPSMYRNPPGILYSGAKSHPFVLIASENPDFVKQITLKVGAMKGDGFDHVMQLSLSPTDDLHYPNMKADWFDGKALPFLDQFATENPTPGTTRPSVAGGDGATSQPSKAETWLSVAKILITNGQTNLAKSKLRAIIAAYPDDPAAKEARELLEKLGG
jgi:hypothetical protein